MNRRRRWFGRWMLLAAAMPLFQAAGCLPDLLATASSNAVSNQFAGMVFTAAETVLYNFLEI